MVLETYTDTVEYYQNTNKNQIIKMGIRNATIPYTKYKVKVWRDRENNIRHQLEQLDDTNQVLLYYENLKSEFRSLCKRSKSCLGRNVAGWKMVNGSKTTNRQEKTDLTDLPLILYFFWFGGRKDLLVCINEAYARKKNELAIKQRRGIIIPLPKKIDYKKIINSFAKLNAQRPNRRRRSLWFS